MKKKFIFMIILVAFAFTTGCSINHPIAKDYHQYLINNEGYSKLPKVTPPAEYFYSIDEETRKHNYEFRAALAGYANLWVVEFGKILEETLQSKDVQHAFAKLTKINNEDNADGVLISFRLKNYEFAGLQANVSLSISVTKNGKESLNKVYTAKGKSQGAKMFFAGAFGMKNATQQSTKDAMDQILTQLINDINRDE